MKKLKIIYSSLFKSTRLPIAAILLLQGSVACKKSGGSPGGTPTASYSKITYTGGDSLSQARADAGAAAAGNKIVFAGGGTLIPPSSSSIVTKTVDIYDTATHGWTTFQLSEARDYVVAAGTGEQDPFCGRGECFSDYSKAVDIYDAGSGNWTTAQR